MKVRQALEEQDNLKIALMHLVSWAIAHGYQPIWMKPGDLAKMNAKFGDELREIREQSTLKTGAVT